MLGYGRLRADFIQTALSLPKYGVINAHASLLPGYRGPAPVNWCLINGEQETGVTTMFTDIGVDDGDIILQQKEPIRPEDTTESLLARLSEIAAPLMVQTLCLVEQGRAPRTPQNSEEASPPSHAFKAGRPVGFFFARAGSIQQNTRRYALAGRIFHPGRANV
ncbi:MAG: methionyl-tRNA formyltransferase [Christensenellales bacterium]